MDLSREGCGVPCLSSLSCVASAEASPWPSPVGVSFEDHFKSAIKVEHPCSSPLPLDSEIQCTLNELRKISDVGAFRTSRMDIIKRIIMDCEKRQLALAEAAPEELRTSTRKIKSVALQRLLSEVGDCDPAVGSLLAEGAPAVGVLLGRPS